MTSFPNIDFRCLELNIRNARLTGQPWKLRRHPMIAWAKSLDPDIIFLQEITPEQLAQFSISMGDKWNFESSHWCAVGYRNDKYETIERFGKTLVGPQNRGFVALKLQKIGSPYWVWAASTHLTAGRLDAYLWRRKQVLEIASLFKPDETPWVMMGASLSSTRTPPHKGVRLRLQNCGLTNLRGKLRSSELIGEGNNTSKAKTNALAKGRWSDDILTGTQVDLFYGRVELTEKFTDNNALKAIGTVRCGLQGALEIDG